MIRWAGDMERSIAISALRLQGKNCDNHNSPPLRFSQNGRMDLAWIRKGLEKPGKTQRGLAAALGVDPAAVNRLLKGERQLKAAEIEKARSYLEVMELPVNPRVRIEQRVPAGGLSRREQHVTNVSPDNLLEVLGMAEGGPDGWNLFNGELVQYIQRPDNLKGVLGAYAVYITGSSMTPRYEQGEIAHIHPGRPTPAGCYVLVQRKPRQEGEPPLAVLKRLVKRTGTKVTLEQYNPPKTFDVPLTDIVSIHRIVGSSEA